MKKFKIVVMVVIGLVMIATSTMSEEAKKDTFGLKAENYRKQTLCPVMGGAIDSTLYIDMQGQRIYFCCGMCIDKFKEDPEKYFNKAAKEGILFENIQTLCPISGNAIDRKHFTYFKGRGVYFCSEKCIAVFDSDPGKYIVDVDKVKDHEGKNEGDPNKKHEEHKHFTHMET